MIDNDANKNHEVMASANGDVVVTTRRTWSKRR
jgi:hypothetical protein